MNLCLVFGMTVVLLSHDCFDFKKLVTIITVLVTSSLETHGAHTISNYIFQNTLWICSLSFISTAIILVQDIIVSPLDYCNSTL